MLGLSKFSELAKDKSQSGRRSLIAAMADLFLSADPERGDHVSIMFGDIVMHVLGDLEEETRLILAQRVGTHPAAPRDMVLSLARDVIDVAEPVLTQSSVLTSEDLSELVKSSSNDHLLAIARRSELDEQVSDLLVHNGEEDVLVAVVENVGAHMAEMTFDFLVERARSSKAIQLGLINREDLPAGAAERLLTFLTDELKKRVSELSGNHLLAQMLAERGVREVGARIARIKGSRQEVLGLVQEVNDGKLKLEEVILELARNDRAAEIAIVLAKINELPSATVAKLIYSKSDKPLIILCKATGLSVDSFVHIMAARAKRLPVTGRELNVAVSRYKAFSKSAADKLLGTIRGELG